MTAAAPHVEVRHLPPEALHALAQGDLDAARAASGLPLTAAFTDGAWHGVWRMRSAQVAKDPSAAAWVTGVVWDVDRQLAVGRAGFHGPPDTEGVVEVGYAVDVEHRRRGYARAALRALLARAAREPHVLTVRASVSPDNTASRDLVLQHGFVEVGEQWDDEDGLEIVYEVPV